MPEPKLQVVPDAGVGGLLDDPWKALRLTPAAARRLLPAAAALLECLRLRASGEESQQESAPAAPAEADRLIDAAEVASRLGISVEAVYRRHFGFARKLGRRTTRFSAAGLDEYIRSRERA